MDQCRSVEACFACFLDKPRHPFFEDETHPQPAFALAGEHGPAGDVPADQNLILVTPADKIQDAAGAHVFGVVFHAGDAVKAEEGARGGDFTVQPRIGLHVQMGRCQASRSDALWQDER